MDFIGGALPNVMFIVGVIAIGIGLGLEFKIVEVKSELSKSGRFGAFGVGAVLIAISIFLYLRPAETASAPNATPVAQSSVALANVAANPAPTEAPAAAAPGVTPEPPSVTPAPPTATPEPPSATPEPPSTPAPPTAVPVPKVSVPDVRGKSEKDARKILAQVGLVLQDKPRDNCEDINMSGEAVKKVKKG